MARLRILVVDDNAQMRTIMRTVLKAVGADSVECAVNGRHALQLIVGSPPDLVFCDYEMPDTNGLAFLAELRSMPPPLRFTPVIMVTGHADWKHVTAARDHGVNEFLSKPVTAQAILSRMDAVIQRPRPFVSADAYIGPDRRRSRGAGGASPQRRRSDQV